MSGQNQAALITWSTPYLQGSMVVAASCCGNIFQQQELGQSDHWVLGHPSPPNAQFAQVTSSRKSPGGSKLLAFTNDGDH